MDQSTEAHAHKLEVLSVMDDNKKEESYRLIDCINSSSRAVYTLATSIKLADALFGSVRPLKYLLFVNAAARHDDSMKAYFSLHWLNCEAAHSCAVRVVESLTLSVMVCYSCYTPSATLV